MAEIFGAARKGDLEKVRSFVERGMDREVTHYLSRTPLHCAAMGGHLEVVQYLVEEGAFSPCFVDDISWTALHLACRHGRLGVVEYLMDQGADRDRRDDRENTPLHIAAMYGHLEVVQCLMSYGADINAKNNDAQTPLGIASTEEIKQAIRDVEQQRYAANFGKKRIPEADLRPLAPPSKQAKAGEEGEGEEDEDDDESSGDDNDEDQEEEEAG